MTLNEVRPNIIPRVLISGHLPPPISGIGAYLQSLLSSSLSQQVSLFFVQTSSKKRTPSKSGTFTISNLVSAIRDCGRFTRAVLVHRPQIVHIASAHGLSFVKNAVCIVTARLIGSRVLLHPHCSLKALYLERPKWWQWLFRRMISRTDGIVALSDEWKLMHTISPSCAVYSLPNAIDLGPYQGIARNSTAPARGERPLGVLYLGCLGKAKGSFDLVDAAKEVLAKVRAVVFDLVGDDLHPGEWEQLKQYISNAGLDSAIRLRHSAIGPEKLALFRDADIFVYPSYYEGMPMAVIEAMASSLPIIATSVGGLPDLVSDGINGLLVEAGRPDQLAAAIQRLSIHPDLRAAMSKSSYQLALEKFDMEKSVPQLVAIYKSVLSKSTPARAALKPFASFKL